MAWLIELFTEFSLVIRLSCPDLASFLVFICCELIELVDVRSVSVISRAGFAVRTFKNSGVCCRLRVFVRTSWNEVVDRTFYGVLSVILASVFSSWFL